MAKKLYTQAQLLLREAEAVKLGYDRYVQRDDVIYYIKNISKKIVKIIELENYEREIPDDIVDKIMELKEKKIFDVFLVIFTDYTGEQERSVEKAKRDKDPILFGCFLDPTSKLASSRLFYIGDWVDEYCDLTMEQLMEEYLKSQGKNIEGKSSIPMSLEELKAVFSEYDEEKKKNKINDKDMEDDRFNAVLRLSREGYTTSNDEVTI